MIYTGPETLVALLPFIVVIPTFWLLKKTLLKNDGPEKRPGFTPKRLLALLILMLVYVVPCTIGYHFLITPIFRQ
ncbi:hypothetical protein HMPREF1987_00824 [Peptostreptococcaceae bacterium oral taxon 113 str. W5053]|nr:hypothetical protein HMPREF1987_00824 [Peptostreptococcaceae bacterium oral taxon 113 str. W5053]